MRGNVSQFHLETGFFLCDVGIALISELYFRFFYDTTDILNYGLSSKRWYERYVQTNSLGFRDAEPVKSLEEDGVSLFFIGDSFTFGLGIKQVEHRYSDIICHAIRKKVSNLRCYNLSYHGWDLNNSVDAFERYAQELEEPNVVLIQYFMNDIEIYERLQMNGEEYSIEELRAFIDHVHAGPSHPALRFLYDHSYAFNFFYLRYRILTSTNKISYEQVRESDYQDQTKYQLVEDEFQRINQINQAYSAQIGVVIFPLMDANRQSYKLFDAHRRLHNSLNDQLIPWLDLRETFWPYTPRQVIVNRFDPHPNEHANALAARELLPFVVNLIETRAARVPTSALNQCQIYEIE